MAVKHQSLQQLQGMLQNVSALDVLNHLLVETKQLEEETVRKAVASILKERQETKTVQTGSQSQESDSQATTATTPDNTACTPPKRTRHIALQFHYDGAHYTGLAQNIGQDDKDNSVERALFQALTKANLIDSRSRSRSRSSSSSCGYSRCGRTDRGVSAAGQVVALRLKSAIPPDATWNNEADDDTDATTSFISSKDLPSNEHESVSVWVYPRAKKQKKQENSNGDIGNHPTATPATPAPSPSRVFRELKEYPYSRILNSLLPPTIRILGWTPVSDEFSARFSATTRLYRYFFCMRRGMRPSRIEQALQHLVGTHDFRNLCKMDVEKVYNFERKIYAATLVRQQGKVPCSCCGDKAHSEMGQDVWYLQIEGQAFLWHQIRCIAEVVFMVGRGLEDPSVIQELLNVEKYPGKPSYALADEKPLVLHNCGYKELHIGYSVANLWTVSCQLEQQWEEHTLAAARLRNCIGSFQDYEVRGQDVVDFCTAKVKERQKKRERAGRESIEATKQEDAELESLSKDFDINATYAWSECLNILRSFHLVPDSQGLNTALHIPLMQRSKGTTYEEKVEALKKSGGKRSQKYEEECHQEAQDG